MTVYRCVRTTASLIYQTYEGEAGERVEHPEHPTWDLFLQIRGRGVAGFLWAELEPLTPEEEAAWRLAGSSFNPA